jgi:hypothetical protein
MDDILMNCPLCHEAIVDGRCKTRWTVDPFYQEDCSHCYISDTVMELFLDNYRFICYKTHFSIYTLTKEHGWRLAIKVPPLLITSEQQLLHKIKTLITFS